MQLSFSRAEALKLFRTVLRAVPETSSVHALECFHLRADAENYELTVTGGNETTRLRAAMPAAVSEGGLLLVNAKTFTGAVAAMDGSVVTIESASGGMCLRDDVTKYVLPTLPENAYPDMKLPELADSLRITGGCFASLYRSTAYAASGRKAKSNVLEMLCFDLKDNKLTVWAGDGFRMASASVGIPGSAKSLRFLLPCSFAGLLASTLEAETEYGLCATPSMAVIQGKNFLAATLTPHFPYPEYGQVLAAFGSRYGALVDRAEFQNGLSLASAASPQAAVRLTIHMAHVELMSQEDKAAVSLTIPCKNAKPTPEEGFYYLPGKLAPALKNHPLPSLRLEISADGLLRIDGDNTAYVQLATMPVRKKNRAASTKAA